MKKNNIYLAHTDKTDFHNKNIFAIFRKKLFVIYIDLFTKVFHKKSKINKNISLGRLQRIQLTFNY